METDGSAAFAVDNAAALKALDPDDDGTIDLKEADAGALKVFKEINPDNDGTLDAKELEGRLTEAELKATALATRGWWHHSIECTIDKLDWKYMDEHVRVYAAYLWELCTAPVLPFTYGPVAEQILKRIQELEKAGAPFLEPVFEKAKTFREKAERLDRATADEAAAFAAGKGSEERAKLLNRAMKRVSRIVVPLMSSAIGKYGHDPYGYTPQTTMIPALYDLAQLSKAKEGEERWMLETKAARDRNRVADMLADAADIIEDSLSRL